MNRHSLIPAAYVLLVRESEVLLQLRKGTGYMDGHWSFSAAGHVERGESVHEAAGRETSEELGVAIAESDLTPICTMHRRQGDDDLGQRVDFFFTCDKWTGAPVVAEPALSGGIRWANLDALPEPAVPYVETVLRMLRDDDPTPIIRFGF